MHRRGLLLARLSRSAWLALAGVLTACSGAPQWVAVAGTGDGIVVYDAALRSADTLPVAGPGAITAVQFAPDGTSLYVTTAHGAGSRLQRLRRSDGVLLGEMAFPGRSLTGLFVSPDARSVLVVAARAAAGRPDSAALLLVRPDLDAVGAELAVCEGEARGIAVFAPSERLFALCNGDTVTEVDLTLRVTVRTAAITGAPSCDASDLAFSANGTLLFVLCPTTGQVRYVDRRTLAVLDSIAIGAGPIRLVRTPGGRRALFPCAQGGEVIAADLRARRITARVETAFVPRDVAVGIDGRTTYVVGGEPGVVAVASLTTGRVTAQVAGGTALAHVAVWPSGATPVMRWTR